LYASPVFNEKFGSWNAEKEKYAVSPAWQSGLSNGARAGEIIGLIIAGWTSDRYGYKMTTIGSLVLMIAFVFVLFFAPNVKILVLGEVLCGKYHIMPPKLCHSLM
jgi:SP family general alpha glucoside:H+ symporter-like MFS transporter